MSKTKTKIFYIVGKDAGIHICRILTELTGSAPFAISDPNKGCFISITRYKGEVWFNQCRSAPGERYIRLDDNNVGLLLLLNPQAFMYHFFH